MSVAAVFAAATDMQLETLVKRIVFHACIDVDSDCVLKRPLTTVYLKFAAVHASYSIAKAFGVQVPAGSQPGGGGCVGGLPVVVCPACAPATILGWMSSGCAGSLLF